MNQLYGWQYARRLQFLGLDIVISNDSDEAIHIMYVPGFNLKKCKGSILLVHIIIYGLRLFMNNNHGNH